MNFVFSFPWFSQWNCASIKKFKYARYCKREKGNQIPFLKIAHLFERRLIFCSELPDEFVSQMKSIHKNASYMNFIERKFKCKKFFREINFRRSTITYVCSTVDIGLNVYSVLLDNKIHLIVRKWMLILDLNSVFDLVTCVGELCV